MVQQLPYGDDQNRRARMVFRNRILTMLCAICALFLGKIAYGHDDVLNIETQQLASTQNSDNTNPVDARRRNMISVVYPSVLTTVDHFAIYKRSFELKSIGLNVLGNPDAIASEPEIALYRARQILHDAQMALLSGNSGAFEDIIATLDDAASARFSLDVTKLFHTAVASNLLDINPGKFREWFHLAEEMHGIDQSARAEIYASLLYLEGKADELEGHYSTIQDQPEHIIGYVAWLTTRLNPSLENMMRASEALNTAKQSDSEDNHIALDVYAFDVHVRNYRRQKFGGANSAMAEGRKLEKSFRTIERLSILEYPLLLAFSYEVLAELYDSMIGIYPNTKDGFEIRRDYVSSIARKIR